MRYRTLGASGLTVSEIALGSWLTVGVGLEREQAAELLDHAFELGINFVDTANVYGRGASEELLGELLAGRPRDSYILATKLYFPMSDTDKGLSAAQVAKQVEASLARLRTDYVDLYQCHRYDTETPLDETMAALTDVVRSGKARFIGFSEWTAPQIAAAHALDGVARFVSSQPEYSILHRKPEPEVIPLCKQEGISQIVFSPLGQGVLSGKYKPGERPPADSRAASETMGWAMDRFLTDDVLDAVQRLRPIADGCGLTLPQLALAWVLREPNVASAIVGASRPSQLDDNVEASGVTLDAATLAAIDEAVSGLPSSLR